MKHLKIPGITFILCLLIACNAIQESGQENAGHYYTCPMHPTVKNNMPGSCPVCNMSLIRVDAEDQQHTNHQGNFVALNAQKQKLAGIKTDTITYRNITSMTRLTGIVSVDEELVKTISARVKGRIEKLYARSTGTILYNGSPLYSIYSEQLQADKKEYLTLLEKSRDASLNTFSKSLLSAAKNKLLLWGLDENQISALEKSADTSPLVTFLSGQTGYITEVMASEGSYVDVGSPLVKMTSLEHLWVEAQIYSNEIAGTQVNTQYLVFAENNPELHFRGTLVYINPAVEDGKRIQLLKIRITNSGGRLRPGALVTVVPEKIHKSVLALPKSAILLEKMKTVWLMINENTFEQRMVETGIENNYWIEIKSGVKQGEIVVTEGAYLLNSEFILKTGAEQRHQH